MFRPALRLVPAFRSQRVLYIRTSTQTCGLLLLGVVCYKKLPAQAGEIICLVYCTLCTYLYHLVEDDI